MTKPKWQTIIITTTTTKYKCCARCTTLHSVFVNCNKIFTLKIMAVLISNVSFWLVVLYLRMWCLCAMWLFLDRQHRWMQASRNPSRILYRKWINPHDTRCTDRRPCHSTYCICRWMDVRCPPLVSPGTGSELSVVEVPLSFPFCMYWTIDWDTTYMWGKLVRRMR